MTRKTPQPADQIASNEKAQRLTETTIAGLGWSSLAMGAQAIIQLMALIVLARLLTPAEFGVYAAALTVGSFCALFSELGVGPRERKRHGERFNKVIGEREKRNNTSERVVNCVVHGFGRREKGVHEWMQEDS